MKTNLIWILFSLLLLNSCKEKEVSTIICGKLPDSQKSELGLISIENYFPNLTSDKINVSTNSDSLGNFKFIYHQNNSGFYQIVKNAYQILKYDVYLEPGDSIYIEQSSWGEEPFLSISGIGSEKLNYQMDDYQIFPMNKPFRKKLNSDIFATEFSFKKFIDSLQEKRIKKLLLNRSVSDKLVDYLRNTIYAESAEILLKHLERRNYNMKGEFDYYYPDSNYYSFLQSINFDNKSCQNSAMKKLAGDFLELKARIALKEKDEGYWWKENLSWKFNYIINQPKNIWRDLLALSMISEYSVGLMEESFFDDLTGFNERVDTFFYSEINQQLYERNVLDYIMLSPGMPAPDFSLPNLKGDMVKLSDFKSKVVYIDFWGTWCNPCIQEIPDAIKLQERYKDEQVIFLYVALEYGSEDVTNWRRTITGKNEKFIKYLEGKSFSGIHVVAEKQFRNENIKPYKLNFAPTHVLIDQEGNIVNVRAEGPKNISDQIDKLLGEN